MAISVKTMYLLALLLVLLSRSEVKKTFIADSFSNGSEASRRGTTHLRTSSCCSKAPKYHDKHRLLNQPRLISFNTISTGNVFFSPKNEKTAFADFPVYQRDVLSWGDLKERIF